MTAKILVVDDEPDVEDLVRQRFRRQIREGSIAFGFARDGKKRWRSSPRIRTSTRSFMATPGSR